MLYDCIYMKYPKYINPERHMEIGDCQGLGGGSKMETLLNRFKVINFTLE